MFPRLLRFAVLLVGPPWLASVAAAGDPFFPPHSGLSAAGRCCGRDGRCPPGRGDCCRGTCCGRGRPAPPASADPLAFAGDPDAFPGDPHAFPAGPDEFPPFGGGSFAQSLPSRPEPPAWSPRAAFPSPWLGADRPGEAAGAVAGPPSRPQESRDGNPGVCPVTGARLGSMGPPVRVVIGGQAVWLCCAGCEARLRRDPGPYLGVSAGPSDPRPVGPTAERATEADAEAVLRQGTCPVTGDRLDPAGEVWKVSRQGRTVFVCCRYCVGQLAGTPAPAAAPAAHARAGRSAW